MSDLQTLIDAAQKARERNRVAQEKNETFETYSLNDWAQMHLSNAALADWTIANGENLVALARLAEEAAEDLCEHPGAVEFLTNNPGLRFWCGECQQYVRSIEGATFKQRYTAAVAAVKHLLPEEK